MTGCFFNLSKTFYTHTTVTGYGQFAINKHWKTIHLHRDLNQASHSSEPCVLTTSPEASVSLLVSTQDSEEWGGPGSSHSNGGFFPVFADSKQAVASDSCMGMKGFVLLT